MRWPAYLSIISLISRVARADLPIFTSSKEFDKGDYGRYVAQQYHSTSLLGPRPNMFDVAGSCGDDGLLVMMTLRGWAVEQAAPMIIDGRARLVWTGPAYVQPYNLQVQTYRGEQFLTFWAGDDGVKGHGSGFYYMLDSHYNERYRLSGGNGLDGDLHEFYITPSGTALITIYQIIQADLTSVGKTAEGWIWDGLFQEIDIETNEVIFQWRASDHLPFTDSQWCPADLGYSEPDSWDWFHINSVEKDPAGNYLISSRWMFAIYYVNGTSGDIIWTLGGLSNDFKDLSGGAATSFASQHQARWHDDYTSITLFDNSNPGPGNPSSGLWLDLDFEEMTVSLRTQFWSLTEVRADSQGSLQTLPSGNVLVGYGMKAQYVEFSREGDVLCEVHLGSDKEYSNGPAQSYRIGKHAWVGLPQTEPDIVQDNGTIYVSWNGATEVEYWLVEDTPTDDAADGDFREAKRVPKDGFETIVSTYDIERPFVRLSGLDKSGSVLGRTRIVARGEPPPEGQQEGPPMPPPPKKTHKLNPNKASTVTIAMALPVSAVVLLSLGLCSILIIRYVSKYSYQCYHFCRRRRRRQPVLEKGIYETITEDPERAGLARRGSVEEEGDEATAMLAANNAESKVSARDFAGE